MKIRKAVRGKAIYLLVSRSVLEIEYFTRDKDMTVRPYDSKILTTSGKNSLLVRIETP